MSISGKLSRLALYQARLMLVTRDVSISGKLVSPLSLHALVKFTLDASVPSFAPAGNDVRAEVPCHADVKLVQLAISVVLKSLSDEQRYHALFTLVAVGSGVLNELSPLDLHAFAKFTSDTSVPSFASCGNCVSAVVPSHADEKLMQLGISVVLKSLSEEQPYQAKRMLVAEGSSELKLSSDEQSLHALLTPVAKGSSVLKLLSDEQLIHEAAALVTSDISPPSN